MSREDLIQRRKPMRNSTVCKENTFSSYQGPNTNFAGTFEEPNLTLMEEILLLGLKDKEGYTSFWNDAISFGLRACILAELSLRNRVALENVGVRKRSIISRKLILSNDEPTGDALLDETMKLIKLLHPPENVQDWIEYLTGESWNPFKFKFQLRNVRERLAKNLAEKGVLTTDKKNFLFFDLTTHPVVDSNVKVEIIHKIKDFLLKKWTNDAQRMDIRLVALILLAAGSEVIENALTDLSDEQYDLANKRIEELKTIDFHAQAARTNTTEVLWAVLCLICR